VRNITRQADAKQGLRAKHKKEALKARNTIAQAAAKRGLGTWDQKAMKR
jgi:hypothetical protein